MSMTISTEGILRGLLDLHGCAVPRDTLDAVLPILQRRAAPRWQFGIGRFALCFDRCQPAIIRAEAEVLTASPAEPADAPALTAIGDQLFAVLQSRHCAAYDAALFDDLAQLTYGHQMPRFRPPKLRFGLGVSWRAGKAPIVSARFDLLAGGALGAEDRLRRIVERLAAGRGWKALARLLEEGTAACRSVTVDFLPGGEHAASVELPGAAYTMPRLRRLAEACDGAEGLAQLEAFNDRLLGGLEGDRTAPGLQLRLGLALGAGSFALSADLPASHPDDFAAAEALSALAARLDIPLLDQVEALQLLAPDTPLAGLQNLQQSCSLTLGAAPRLDLYLAPLANRSEHLPPDRRPRLKPAFLADLDAAARKAITALQNPSMPLGAETALALLQAASHGFAIDAERITSALDRLALLPGDALAALLPLTQLALLAKAPEAGALCDDVVSLLFDPTEAQRTETAIMADLAQALLLRGDTAALHRARQLAMLLAARQGADGLWPGADAAERIETSFRVVRVLARVLPDLPLLARAALGLRAAQDAAGGWGDAASSARALAACALLHELDPEGAPALTRGLSHLLQRQLPDGSWDHAAWTTACCLEALVALRRPVEQGMVARAAGLRPRVRMLLSA